MFSKEIAAHLKEFGRAIRGHKWEQHANGILIPEAKLVLGGKYSYRLNKGEWSDWEPNLIPTEGINFFLDLLGNHAAIPSCYIAQFSNNYTPIAANTAASFTATYGEITSGSEGYSEATRVAWVSAAASAAAIHNNASPAEFTIVTASTLTSRGVAMLTASAKGATTGKLISASLFSAARVFSNTDLFDVKYQIGGTSS